jgi:O-antigen ligase
MEDTKYKRILNLSFQAGIFIFPLIGGFVRDAGSVVYVLLGLISLFYLRNGTVVLNKKEKLIFYGFICYFTFISLTIFLADEIKPALSQIDRSLRYLAFIPMYLAVRRNEVELSQNFLNGLAFAGIALFPVSLVIVDFLGVTRAHGGYQQNVFALYCAVTAVVLIAAILLTDTAGRKKYFYMFGAIGAILTSYLTETRSSWLAIVVGTLVILAFLFRKNRAIAGRWLAILLATLVLVFVFVPGVKDRINKAVVEVKLEKSGANVISPVGSRLEMWKSAYDMSKKSSFLGVGIGNYESVFKRDYIATGKINKHINTRGAHSIYFQALAEIGIVGLGVMIISIFLIPIYVLLIVSKNKNSWYFAGGLSTLAVFAVVGFTENWTGRNPMINLYLVSIMVIFTGVFQALDKESGKPRALT